MKCFEAGVTGYPRDASQEKWVLAGGIEMLCTYIKCMEQSNKKAICAKKITGLINSFDTL